MHPDRTANANAMKPLAEAVEQGGVFARNMLRYAGLAEYEEIIEGPGDYIGKKGMDEEMGRLEVYSKLHLYPNPADDLVNVEFELEGTGYLVGSDMWGREVFAHRVSGNNKIIIQTDHLPAGLYIVRLQTDEGKIIELQRLMLQK